MGDHRESGKNHREALDPGAGKPQALTRRGFLEHGARVGLGVGAASVLANGLWVPTAAGASFDDALGAGDEALQARGQQRAQTLTLSNAAISAQWSVDAGHLHFLRVAEPNGAALDVPDDVFTLVLAGGFTIRGCGRSIE